MEETKLTKEELVAKLTAELEAHKVAVKNKQYAVATNDIHLLLLNTFLKNDVKWTGMEALGVIELHKKFKAISEDKEKYVKNGFMFLSKLELDAISFFHSSISGLGYASANNFIAMIKPFNEPLKEAKNDFEHGNHLELQLASVEEGIDIEGPIEKTEFTESFDTN